MLPLEWFLVSPCALCASPLSPTEGRDPICAPCRAQMALRSEGLRGGDPLPWWGAGHYDGPLRELLLDLRRQPRPGALAALMRSPLQALTASLNPEIRPRLVPIPGWKRRANPLPGLLCLALAHQSSLRRRDLLERSRPVLGQHHLGLRLRRANQVGAFRCLRPPAAGEARRHPLLIVDDILTSGATACSAAETLRAAGWRVHGVLCLAKTPFRGAMRAEEEPTVS